MIKYEDINSLYGIEDNYLSILHTYAAPWKRDNTQLWRSSDEYESFIKIPVDDYKFQYWKDKEVEYRYNDYGFRTDVDFSQLDRGSIFLGCSFTEGIGLPIEMTWGYKVASALGTPFINLGVAGKGVDTAYRNLLAAVKDFKIDNVFLFIPPLYRQEFIVEDNEWFTSYINKWRNDKGILNIAHGGILKHWVEGGIAEEHKDFFNSLMFGSHKQAIAYSFKTVQAIQQVANTIGTNFYCLGYEQFNTSKQEDRASKIPDDICEYVPARDRHWDSKRHHLIADSFLEMIGGIEPLRLYEDSVEEVKEEPPVNKQSLI